MTEPPPEPSQPPPELYIHTRRELFEHGLIPLHKLIFTTDATQTLTTLRNKLLQQTSSPNRITSSVFAETLQISPEHAKLVFETIESVNYEDSDSIGCNVYDLVVFLYVQSYKRLMPKGRGDSAVVADVWPSTSAFDGFLSALTPLQVVLIPVIWLELDVK
ncbi:TBCC domain-containing protein 1-like protein [Tanacetum coccineum]